MGAPELAATAAAGALLPAAQPAGGGPRRRQPVYVVCSPRPRVGHTFVARLLTEHILADGRRAIAFDVNPDDRALARHLPLHALPASLADTRGEMALFDRLIVNDGAAKVVDLAADFYHPFFDLMHRIGFAAEARARAIDVVLLFITSNDRKAESAYRRLLLRRDQVTVVPVENPGAAPPLPGAGDLPGATPPLVIEPLPFGVQHMVERKDFSFVDCARRPAHHPPTLAAWLERTFLALRDLDLRLQMAEFAALFRA
jgi:hypothetical protein